MTLSSQPGSSPALLEYVLPTASLLTVALLGYIARIVRKFLAQHDWLMTTAKQHDQQIADNTKAIKRMLEQREKLIRQQGRRRR